MGDIISKITNAHVPGPGCTPFGMLSLRNPDLSGFGFIPISSGQAYMERDDEALGKGNLYTTAFRAYDSRLGRWMSREPKESKYPFMSPYVGMANNPILYIALGGEDVYLAQIPLLKALYFASRYTKHGSVLYNCYQNVSSPSYRNKDVYFSSYSHPIFQNKTKGESSFGWTSAPLNISPGAYVDNNVVVARTGFLGYLRVFGGPDDLKFSEFDGLVVQKPSSDNQLISFFEGYLNSSYIFDGVDKDKIKKASDVGSLEVHRFKSILFCYFHEFFDHVKLDGDGQPPHTFFGNTSGPSSITYSYHKFSDWAGVINLFQSSSIYPIFTDAAQIYFEISGLSEGFVKNLIFDALLEERKKGNNPNSFKKAPEIKDTPLMPAPR